MVDGDEEHSEFPWPIQCTYGHDSAGNRNFHPIVDYIILAEFDIDTGSTVRHQYPAKIPYCTADWLAENMLPEGVHNRNEDWTYMFLNRNCPRIDQQEVSYCGCGGYDYHQYKSIEEMTCLVTHFILCGV